MDAAEGRVLVPLDSLPELPPRRPDPPDPAYLAARFSVLLAVAAAAVTAYAAWLLTGIGTPLQRRMVSDLVFVVAPILAGVSAWSAHRRRRERHSGWGWIAAGCWTWAAASVVWSVYELLLGEVAPFPSFADIGYVFYSVPIAIGLFRFPSARGNVWSRLRVALDIVVMAASLLLASAMWVLTPVIAATAGGFTRIDALAYPLADVTIATVVLSRSMLFARSRRRVWMTLSAGLLVEAFTDSVYVTRTFGGHYHPGQLLDLGWMLSFVLVGLAAQMPSRWGRDGTSGATEPPSFLQQLLPYVALAVAGWAVISRGSLFAHNPSLTALAIGVGVATGIRQLVVVADQVSTTHDLHAAVQRRTAEIEYREQWWRDLVKNLTDVVVVVDADGTVKYCSPSLQSALGHQPRRMRGIDSLRALVHPDDLAALDAMLAPVLGGVQRRGAVEARLVTAQGDHRRFEMTAVGQVSERALQGAVLTLHDVTERHRLTEQLSHQAFHDALTGLPNRILLMQRLDEALARGMRFSLVLIDLDDFKLINDSHGHGAGDLVLAAIGKRLSGAVRAQDTVARLGGDEFAVLVPGHPERAQAVARRIRDRLSRDVAVDGRRFRVSSSVGVVVADHVDNAQALLSHADVALYRAKSGQKGGVVVIAGCERDEAAKQVRLREEIARPDLSQFSVVYQPIVDLSTLQLRGLEALLRWTHPDYGAVSPVDFIPLAEQAGVITTLGWFVLDTALAQLATWQQQVPHHRLAVGVNLSVLQLDERDFAARVIELVRERRVAPDQLVLEVTEQALARDFETAVAVVADLRRHGISVAVDDFGTGYSSLRYLHRFEADVVKIDRGFIATIQGSPHTQKIVKSVVDMAGALDIQCIAEGIETASQLQLVRSMGCELGQGYLFAQPLPAEQVMSMVGTPFAIPAEPTKLPQPRKAPASARRVTA